MCRVYRQIEHIIIIIIGKESIYDMRDVVKGKAL